ncbi:MAG: UvrD-helicase domain-containing protein [Bacteroidota bacterium]
MNTFEKIKICVQTQSSFVVEAGAGSGKTFTLIQTLNHILETKGSELKFNNRSIVCITYTNVAKNEIIERIEHNPNVLVLTIHEFLWSTISNYQKQLLKELELLNDEMCEQKPDKFEPNLLARTSLKEVIYNDSGYRDFEKGSLHHDDVITIASRLIHKYGILTTILSDKYPYIFIDEYQDTAPDTIDALINALLTKHKSKVLVGFFGDSYQKIYDGGVGDLDKYITDKKLTLITKEENYRSSLSVITLLNNVRTNIQQFAPESKKMNRGSALFINCNNYPAKGKQKVTEYESLLTPIKNSNYDLVVKKLIKEGWDFGEKSMDKVLIITNSRVSAKAGFGNLYRHYATRYGQGANDQLLKRDHVLVRFFCGSLDKKSSKERKNGIEHLMTVWEAKDFGSVVSYFNKYGGLGIYKNDHFRLKNHSDKKRISEIISNLQRLRESGTVKEVFDFVIENEIILLQEGVRKYISRIKTPITDIDIEEERTRLEKDLLLFNSVMALSYLEFIKLFKHTQNQTVFSTKHSTKGDEFRNVLVVLDDTSWKQEYNFQKFINNNDDTHARLQRTRNLFYVSCSRAVENLVVLSLSEMESDTMGIVSGWFDDKNVFSIKDVS